MRENRKSGSEGGEAQTNELSLPLSWQRAGWQSDLIGPREVLLKVDKCGIIEAA